MTGEVKRYEIDRISDLLAVPIDRRADCLRQLEYALSLHEFGYGERAQEVPFTLTWTDDGKMDSTLTVNSEPKPWLTLEVHTTGATHDP